MKYIKTIILTLFFYFGMDAQGDRDVYWLHGFTGNSSNIDQYANRYSAERQMTSSIPGYATQGSIDEITNGLSTSITNNPGNFAVGHSLGAIVARNIEIEGDESEINGYITIHGPNQGANVAAAVLSGEAEEFLTQTEREINRALDEINDHLRFEINLIQGLGLALHNVLGGLDWFVWFNGDGWRNDVAEDPNADDLAEGFDLASDLLSNPDHQQIINDLAPDGEFMNRLNNFNSNLPSIEVHGFEEGPELFRLLCSRQEMVWNRPLATTQPYPDDCLLDDIDDALDDLNMAVNLLGTKGSLGDLFGLGGRNHEARRRVWEGRETIRTLNATWLDLIGVPYEVVQEERRTLNEGCQASIDHLNRLLLAMDNNRPDESGERNITDGMSRIEILDRIRDIMNDDECWNTEIVDVWIPVEGADSQGVLNDGFILEQDQVTGNADLTYRNIRVNHWEVLNHPQMMRHFDDMWTNGGYFATDPR